MKTAATPGTTDPSAATNLPPGEKFEVTIVHVGGERRTLWAVDIGKGEIAVAWSALNPPMRFQHITGAAVLKTQRTWSLAPESRRKAGYVPEKRTNRK